MEDIDKELIKVLSGLGYPVYRQGSMSDSDDYPDTFFTFWNYETPDHSHYDNEAYGAEWSYNIYALTPILKSPSVARNTRLIPSSTKYFLANSYAV